MKLKGLTSEAWVTCAVTDDDAKKCIVLARSLKRVSSNRSVVIMTSTKVSLNFRSLLHCEFDYVFILEEDMNTANLNLEEFGKLSLLRLKSFDACCFVSPNMMFLKNADEIFEVFAANSFACPEMDPTLSIFLVKPSLEAFDVLMKALRSRNGTPVSSYIRNWFFNQKSNLVSSDGHLLSGSGNIGPQYHRTISLRKNEGVNEIPGTDTFIVHFLDDPTVAKDELKATNLGMLDHHAVKIWTEIYAKANNECNQGFTMRSRPSFADYTYDREPIAIVGMSCRYPGSNNLEEFWDLLFRGQDGTGNPPPFRWLKEQCARNRPDCRKTNAGFLNVPVDDFDAKFFGISPKEVLFMDPQHRLLHELVWEGLEEAAIDPLGLRGTNAGVFMGSWTNDYRDILSHAGVKEFYRVYMGNSIGAAAARISHLLGLTGPSVATESGCSSAMVAVHLACRSLLLGETNLALACGVNLLLHPFDKDEMPMVISPEGRCKTFDANADGFARGEGCGVLVLKRLSDAIKDNDNIWALIRGSATSQEGVSRSMGTPTVHCESLAMELALKDSLVHPNDVSYVEAHGTGTVVGDPMEVSAIAKAYGSTRRDEPLIIGSVKTNVGHTESCSGITGIMKVVLAMHHDVIPPHRNFETLNPNINLDLVPARLPLEPMEWKQKVDGKPRIAGVSSFGITGTDAHAIIEEAPKILSTDIDLGMERPKHILKISAKTEEALNILLEKYAERIENSNEELSDICYTANTGRADFPWRTAIVGDAKEDIANKIKQGNLMKQETEEEHGKICFLFTGQGSQYPGMAKQLYDSSPVFKMHFDYCEGLLKDMYSVNIRDVLWGERQHEVSRTIYSQTSIFCVEYALLKLWESWGVKPDYVLGHSLGEFAAAVCAGVLKPRDALMLVAERSRLIDQLPTGKMLVIKADKSTVDQAMKSFSNGQSSKILDYAAINSSQQTVVAGDSDVILEFAVYLTKTKNLKSIVLEATHAFHSKHMDPMLDSYRKIAETVKRKDYTNCEYISGMKGAQVGHEDIDADYWAQHTRQPVNFLQASKTAVELGCNIFIEIGPQPVLAALTMLNTDGVSKITCLPSLKKNENEWETILQTLSKLYLSGVNIDWKDFDKLYLRKKVRLPHYPFIGKKFWPDMLAATGNTIHPLLGTIIQNASSTRIFQNGLNLRSLEYVKDHAIGHTAVFPGAGYLEMALAAGLATVECSSDSLSRPTRPMMVENLKITAPLALEESKTCQVQVVVDFNTGTGIIRDDKADWDDLSVKIFHKLESKWLCHAAASFVPLPRVEEINKIKVDKGLFNKLKEYPLDESEIVDTYEKLASVGLKFGPIFKSVENVWRDSNSDVMLAKLKPLPDSNTNRDYVVHPVLLDAMIQAVMMHRLFNKSKKKMYVPISVKQFFWLSNHIGNDMYVYVTGNGADVEAILTDGDANIVASMCGVELIVTTVKAVESVLEQQTSMMPDLWEESWRGKLGPMQHRLPDELLSTSMYTSEFKGQINKTYNVVPQEREVIFETLENLVFLWMLNCLYECGWEPMPNDKFTTADLVKQLGIEIAHTKFVNYFLEVFSQKEFCRKLHYQWEIVRMPPSKEETVNLLQSPECGDSLIREFDPTRLINKIGRSLADVFKGKASPLPILFPENLKTEPSVSSFYDDYGEVFNVAGSVVDITRQRVSKWLEDIKNKDEKFVLRIVEVGAGTGIFASLVIPVFEELKIDYEYTYTDISAAFFPAAEKRFEKFVSKMRFKKLDIEADPVGQGFCPGYYDYVIASDVIHATKNIGETLRNCRKLLRKGGIIDILEQIKTNRVITFVFGLMEGFWRYEDFRKDHCIIDADAWAECLQKSGFEGPITFPSFNDRHALVTSWATSQEEIPTNVPTTGDNTWLLFSREGSKLSDFLQSQLQFAGRKVVVIKPSSQSKCLDLTTEEITLRPEAKSDFDELMEKLKENKCCVEGVVYMWAFDNALVEQEDILKPYLHIVQSIFALKQKRLPKLCAVTNGVVPVGDNDLAQFHASTLWGFTKALRNENTDMNCRCIGVASEDAKLSKEQMAEVFNELWSEDKEPQIAYSNGSRYVARFQSVKPSTSDLPLPSGTNRFQLILPETKSINDLSFGPMEPLTLEPDEIEIQVCATALNFRDVFSVLKPTKFFEKLNSVGFDFSGVVKRLGQSVTKWKVGDHVFGVNMKGNALPSHIKLNEEDVLAVPDDMTLNEACTLPAVVATSYHCLIDVAKITKDDTVLIHTASGGVGLSAMQIVQSIGAKIIATAGSKRKQNYLRSLGIEHIFNSRNTEYGDKILEVTNGRGVDVVLNSLTSEGFKEATLKACAKGARFVEMSKLSIWEPEEVRKLRPDVKYTVVDLSSANSEEWKRLLQELRKLSDAKIVKPIPYTRFDAVNIREALQYLQKAKHIGKVVCVMPELRFEEGRFVPYTPMFNDRSTYLITGGLGGIGFEVAKWMVRKGAKHILLASRNPPKEQTQAVINEMNKSGANLIPIQLDVGNYERCKNLFESIGSLNGLQVPRLRGIMHAAGTLSDGLIVNQEWDKLSSTFNAKVKGTLNLHRLTEHCSLEHFVLFSSIASLYGSPGQSNHAAGNNFEDTLAHFRHSMGKCATTVNWGQWGEIGVAVEVDLPGMKALSTLQGISALEYIMKSQRLQTCVMNMESFVLFSKLSPQTAVYLDEKLWKAGSSSSTSFIIKSDEFWQQYDSIQEHSEKVEMIKRNLVDVLRKILKLENNEPIGDEANFQEMGVDSLMFVEIKNAVQALLGDRVTVSANSLRDCNNVKLLSEQLMKIIEGDDDSGDLETPPTFEEVNALIKEDCMLPEEVNAAGRPIKKTSEIRKVLLTGSTGTLGPYILKELTQLPQIQEVYCLIRPNKAMTAAERLERALEFREIVKEVNVSKVKIVEGNVAKPNLGLSEDKWIELTETVDAIFHCAVKASHVEYYKKQTRSSARDDIRSVNIEGVKNVLRFASKGQVKHVFMSSAIIAVTSTNEDDTLLESWPNIADFDNVTRLAYPISKFVGDILMKTAVLERGIPGKAFRFPLIAGDSRTGKFRLDQNHLMLRYMFILKKGIMPSTPFPLNLLPVDTCASLSVNIFFSETVSSESDIYNISHPSPDLEQAFVAIAEEMGYQIGIIEDEEFNKILLDEKNDSNFSLFKDFYRDDNDTLSLYTSTKALRKWLEGVEDFWASKKLTKLCPQIYCSLGKSIDNLKRDVMYAQRDGWFQKFGLSKP